MKLPYVAMNTLVMHLHKANVSTRQGALDTLGYADDAISYISEKRSVYGAYQNRLEHAYENNRNTGENTTAAESRLRDADVAEEMVAFTKRLILEQAGQAVLAQANQSTQGIVGLLR